MQLILALLVLYFVFKMFSWFICLFFRQIKVFGYVTGFFVLWAVIVDIHMIYAYLSIAFFISVIAAVGLDADYREDI